MPSRSESRRNTLLFVCGGLLGIAAFLLVFGPAPLDVTNDAFCRGGYIEKDIQQHYAGWLFYRQSPLRFPLCIAESVNWPAGLSVAYTDSIPAVRGLFPAALPPAARDLPVFRLVHPALSVPAGRVRRPAAGFVFQGEGPAAGRRSGLCFQPGFVGTGAAPHLAGRPVLACWGRCTTISAAGGRAALPTAGCSCSTC